MHEIHRLKEEEAGLLIFTPVIALASIGGEGGKGGWRMNYYAYKHDDSL